MWFIFNDYCWEGVERTAKSEDGYLSYEEAIDWCRYKEDKDPDGYNYRVEWEDVVG